MEIIVPGTMITVATVIAAFILNQAMAWLGLEVSELWRKAIVFLVAVAITGYYGVQAGFPLPDPGTAPADFAVALLAAATAVFKVAQSVYDKIWQSLLKA